MSLIRPPSAFDLVSDDQLYNQDLSSVLMVFNPIYSNILPFGDATPNRTGIYLKAKINNEKNVFISTMIWAPGPAISMDNHGYPWLAMDIHG